MEALLTSFIAAALGELGDKTQLLVIALAAHYRRPGTILIALLAAALANSLIAALGGTLVHDMITLRAISLLLAVALLYAGIIGLMTPRHIDVPHWKAPVFLVAAISLFAAEFGDKTQFLTFALAAKFDSLSLAALGATGGVVAANIPAVILGERLGKMMPLKAIRITAAAIFILLGFILAMSSLRLT